MNPFPHQADIRIPSVRQHLLRIFGINRHQSLYGVDGDRIVAEFNAHPEKGYAEPVFMLQGQHNQGVAYMLLCSMALATWLLPSMLTQCSNAIARSTMATIAYQEPPTYVSPGFTAQAQQFRFKPPNPYNHKGPQQPRMQICTGR